MYQYFKGIVATYTVSKNKEAKVRKPDNEMIYDLIHSNQKLDEKKFPHLIQLYGSGYLAYIDILNDGLEINDSTKNLFFERISYHENVERPDPRIVLMSDKKRKQSDY